MIPETVTPAGLRERAKIMRDILDESCARHLELAADEIERLRCSAATEDAVAGDAKALAEKINLHLQLGKADPGFHLSEDDLCMIVKALLRSDAVAARAREPHSAGNVTDLIERLKGWDHGNPKTMIVSEAITALESFRDLQALIPAPDEIRHLRLDNARLRDEAFMRSRENARPSQLCSCKASDRDGQHMAWCPSISSTDALAQGKRDPAVVAAVQQALMKHPHFHGNAASAFGFANTAIDAYTVAISSTDEQTP